MNKFLMKIVGMFSIAATIVACSVTDTEIKTKNARALPPEPVVTYTASDAEPGQRIDHGEVINDVDKARQLLHAQHHPHKAAETRTMPGNFEPPAYDINQRLRSP